MRPYRIVMTLMIIGAAGISTPGITLGQDSKSGTAPSSDTPSQIAPKPTSAAPSENAAEVAPSGAVDRGIKIRKSIPVMGKGKRWAVVVGIQYTKEDRSAWKDRGEIPPLANAENDADDFATMLKGKYGYTEDKVFLLKGKEATRDAITDLLAEGLICNGEKVGADDSVLFYFSGHGSGPESGSDAKEETAFLLPLDAKVNEKGQPNSAFAIDIGAVAAKLRKVSECKARHVLLILDCCHSGAVFTMQGTSGGAFEHDGVDDSLLRTRSVQAIASSRATEKASDGTKKDRNSPFTRSMLRALMELPPSLPRDSERFFFTTNQLFHAMKAYESGNMSADQSPLCRWLDGINAGEFVFLPDANASFDEVSDESLRLLLTMVPSTFGNWWAEEMPWFMPGLRLEILENRAETKSTLADQIDKGKLRVAAELTLKRLNPEQTRDVARNRRLDHLKSMLDAEESGGRRLRYLKLINELKEAAESEVAAQKSAVKGAPAVEAVDIHELAILQHLVGQHKEAKASYEQALVMYQEESKQFIRKKALESLCRSDYGTLLGELNDNDHALPEFQTARSLFGLATPIPFRVFCLTKEADSHLATGFSGASDRSMDEAISLMKSFDPNETHPLSAAAYNHYAWAKMRQWQFSPAEEKFKKTREILSKPMNLDRPECAIDQLHVKHGLAMIHRFQGNDGQAIAAYSDLTRDIAQEIAEIERNSAPKLNLGEVRALLFDRLVNSFERQADCYLYGRNPDYEAAAFYYRRGLLMVGQVPENRRAAIESDLLYRQSIALSLQGLDLSRGRPVERPESLQYLLPEQPPEGSKLEETPLASSFLAQQSDRILERAKSADSSTESGPMSVQVDRAIAEFLSRTAKARNGRSETPDARDVPKEAGVMEVFAKTATKQKEPLEDLLDHLRGSKRDLDRDELERLMFAYRLLIRQHESKLDTFSRLELAERLHELCRSALRLADSDPGVLTYLRPYFDAVYRVKIKYQPVGTKELIELVWEATTGELSPPPAGNQPVLAMYFLDNRCHLLLDVPHGRSGRFEIDPDELSSLEMIAEVSKTGRNLPCPNGLRKGLRAIRLSDGQKLLVHYRDPVNGIGGRIPRSSVDSSLTAKPASYSSPASETGLPGFPFEIQSSLAHPSYKLQMIEGLRPVADTESIGNRPGSSTSAAPDVSINKPPIGSPAN